MRRFCFTMLCMFLSIALFASSPEWQRKSFSVDSATIEAIDLSIRERNVMILQSSNNQISIEYYDGESLPYDISVENSTLKMIAGKSNKLFGIQSMPENKTIYVTIPTSMIDKIKLQLKNGDCRIEEIAFLDRISIKIDNGNLIFNRLNAGNFN